VERGGTDPQFLADHAKRGSVIKFATGFSQLGDDLLRSMFLTFHREFLLARWADLKLSYQMVLVLGSRPLSGLCG